MPGDTLITGGSGFLGTAVARAILCRDRSRGVVLGDITRKLGTRQKRGCLALRACCLRGGTRVS